MDVPISSARRGLGEQQGSQQTPRGWHQIRACIGAGAPAGAVFVGRRPTGEIHTSALALANPQRDWVLTRILWLSGLEPGRNRGGERDSARRYIYIHACPASEPLGIPRSHGCIRLSHIDCLDLFARVSPGTRVFIGG